MVDYLEASGELPVLPAVQEGDVRAQLPTSPPEQGEPLSALLADFHEIILPGITHWNHPSFFGYFPTSASAPGILGELLAATLNVNAMVWRSSPAATELEEVATGWLRQLMGLPDGFEGVINDTASSSSLYALAAAREQAYPDARRKGLFGLQPGRVYASDQAHSSIEKAALVLGLGVDGCRKVETDADFRMRPEALRAALDEDQREGIKPVAIVATVGTTSSSSVDPVADIARVAEEHGAWLHVDAAYGGPAAMVPELRPLFEGWERADSLVANPHKWLFTPIDCSVLFCRRPEALARAFSVVPEYLAAPDRSEARNLMEYGVSLGRRFRSLKLWFVLRYFGREGLIERIRSHVELARTFAGWVDQDPDWSRVAPVPFSTVAFRLTRDAGMPPEELDALNLDVLETVNRTGEAFLTHTVLAGRVALRLSIGNLRTTEEHVARTWTLLRQAAVRPAG